jgi:hypothetical protein
LTAFLTAGAAAVVALVVLAFGMPEIAEPEAVPGRSWVDAQARG